MGCSLALNFEILNQQNTPKTSTTHDGIAYVNHGYNFHDEKRTVKAQDIIAGLFAGIEVQERKTDKTSFGCLNPSHQYENTNINRSLELARH